MAEEVQPRVGKNEEEEEEEEEVAAEAAVVTLPLALGTASTMVPVVPVPGRPGYGFQYFNMHDSVMLPFVLEGARLLHEAAPVGGDGDNVIFVTVETSTLEMAHELRARYGRTVLTISKKRRPTARRSGGKGDDVLHHTYTPVTAVTSSTVYLNAAEAEVLRGEGVCVVLFDNVVTSGATLHAAAQLVHKAGAHIVIDKAIVMYTEGEGEPQTQLEYSVDETEAGMRRIPLVSLGGHLPMLPLSAATPPEYNLYSSAVIPSHFGKVRFMVYTSVAGRNAIAVVGHGGDIPDTGQPVPVRVHDACMTSECFHSCKCDCREQLELALQLVQQERGGLVIYLLQEGRGIGLAAKIAAYAKQEEEGLDTVDANRALGLPDDCRTYVAARDILADLGIGSVALITNNPRKVESLTELGVHVDERIPAWATGAGVSAACRRYMAAKVARMNHTAGRVVRFYEPEDENGILSNLWLDPEGREFLRWQGRSYRSAEHAYQCAKARLHGCTDGDIERIATAADGHRAFEISRDILGNSQETLWLTVRVPLMREILSAKAECCDRYRSVLRDLDGAVVEEASPVDGFWGVGADGNGENWMGVLTAELAKSIASVST